MIRPRAQGNSPTARALRLDVEDPRFRWPTQITSRPFARVCAELGLLPDAKRYRGIRVVSIGEGFSDFAQTLERAGADVTAVDPLYGLTRAQLSKLWICGGETGTEFGLHLKSGSRLSAEERGRLTMTPEQALSRCARKRIAGDLEQLPLAAGSFDLVCCSHVLVHLNDPALQLAFRVDPRLEAGVEKMFSLLRPGGVVRCLASREQYAAASLALQERHPDLVQRLSPVRLASTQRLWLLARARDGFEGRPL